MSTLKKVKFLRAYRTYSYSAGDITSLSTENITMLQEAYEHEKNYIFSVNTGSGEKQDPGPYIQILAPDYQEPTFEKKLVPESDYIKVRFLKPHPSFSYKEGSIGKLTPENAIKLLEGDFIEVLPEDFIEPVSVGEIIPESDKIEVRFIRVHPAFAYNVGDETKLYQAQVDFLLKDGYIQVIPKNEKQKKITIERLKSILKKI
jgi:hypothetical protein